MTVLKLTRASLMSNIKEKTDENKHTNVQNDIQLTITASIHLSCKYSFSNPGQSFAYSLL